MKNFLFELVNSKIIFYKKLIHYFLKRPLFFQLQLILFFSFTLIPGFSQVIYQHDFGTTEIDTHPYVIVPPLLDVNISNSIWSNSKGSWTSFGGYSGEAIAFRPGLGNSLITLTFNIADGYSLSVTKYNFWSQRSNAGPTDWTMTINGVSVGTGNVPISGESLGITEVLNSSDGLTGNITIQIALAGATDANGTFRLDDFTLFGSVTPLITYYRSRQSGNWTTSATWESSTDNVNWNVAAVSPTKDADQIVIQSGHTVNVNSSVSLDQTTIAGTLLLQTGGILNINDGVGDDILIPGNGLLQITSSDDYSSSVSQQANADINIAANGKIEIGDGSSFTGDGYEYFATSLVNVWNDGAVFEYNSSNITFETNSLTYFPNAAESIIPIFRITKVNGSPGAGKDKDFRINGIIEVNTDLTFHGDSKKYFRNGIRGTATISNGTGGKFYLSGPNAILDGSSLNIVLSAVMDLAPNTIVPEDANVTISGKNVNNGGLLTINGILDVTNININNANDLVVLNGTYRTSHSGGFSGDNSSIPSTSGTITLYPGSTIELYANGPQSLNARGDFSNLIFSGSGTKIPTGSFSPAGTVTIKDDVIFDCSGRNIGDETSSGPTATNLTMSGNTRLIIDTYGPNPKMAGAYNLSGGVIEFKGSNGTPQNIRSKNYQNIEVTGSNVLMSEGNITLNDGGTFTVKNGGVFAINDNTIIGQGNGTETIIVESGGIFECGNNKGFNGSDITSIPIQSSSIHENITNIVLGTNSTVDYSRDGDQPITNANGLVYQNLVISGTGNKTAPSDNLIVQGNFAKTSSATFVGNGGTVIFNGTNSQDYSSVTPQTVFNNLTNENITGLNINDSLSVYKNLLLEDNSIINLNADVTLLSRKEQTASIGQLGTNAIINYPADGRFIVERYVNTNTTDGGHPKSWQFLSTPAYGETIYDTWQEKGSTTISGYGTWITDPSYPSNGFDATSVAPSMKYFDPATNSWIGISGTNINLENQKGYMVFIRGDRNARSINSPATPTILRSRGKIYTRDFLPPSISVSPGKFQSIGNPYASVIDFSKINSSNIESSYSAWDPTLGGDYRLGGYQTITAATGYRAVPGNTANYNTTSDYRFIQSGQAFFVYNYTSSPGSVSFAEESKVSDNQHSVNREADDDPAILFVNLISVGTISDGNAVAFDPKFSNAIDGDDAFKLNNGRENFAIKSHDKILAVEARDKINISDTIFYHLTNLAKKDYQLKFVPLKIQPGFESYLIDQFLKTQTYVSLTDTTFVDFSITDDKTSKLPDRFYLVFRTATPVVGLFLSMNALYKDGNVWIDWEVKNENGVKNYEVEYSKDGIRFSRIGEVNSKKENLNIYHFIHEEPRKGNNFYRIKINKSDGEVEYNKVVKVFIIGESPSIKVYPNPVSEGVVRIQFINQPKGKYRLNLFNSLGQRIASKEIIHEGGSSYLNFEAGFNLIKGLYNLEILKPDENIETLKVRK